MLQYLVGVEGIVPDIITATSAGAIAATVLAQARTLAEFARPGRTRSRATCWPGRRPSTSSASRPGSARSTAPRWAARSTRRSPRAPARPSPSRPSTVLAGNEVVPACDRRTARGGARPAGPGAGASATSPAWSPVPGSGCPGSGATCAPAAAPSSTSTRWPTRSATAARTGVRAVDPALIARPGLQLRLAVTALRAGVLRYVTEDGTIVESDARTPAPGESGRAGRPGRRRHRLGQRAHGLPAPPHGRRRLRRRRGDRDRARSRAAAALGATRIIAVVAVPLAAGPRRAGLRGRPRRLHRPALHGDDRRGRAADLEPQRPPARGRDADHDRPRRRRGGPVRGRAGAPAHQQGLRLAARRRRPGRRRRRHPGRHGRRHPRHRRGAARGLAPGGVAVGRRADRRRATPGRWRSCASRRSGSAPWWTGASSSASRCPTAARTGGPATRPTRPSGRRACRLLRRPSGRG